ILRQEGQAIGFGSNFTIHSQGDQVAMIKQILVDLNCAEENLECDKMLSLISKAKNQLVLPEQLVSNESLMGQSQIFVQVYRIYQARLRAHQAMDFDDLLLYVVLLFHADEDLRQRYVKRYQHILVDEYQDTNLAQFELIKLLTHKDSNITVVGDDDQSIYSWRGAAANAFQSFEEHYASSKTIVLDQNYRSTGNILSCADAVIRHNPNRKAKTLWSNKGSGDLIHFYDCEDEADEAARVVDLLFKKKFDLRAKYHDFAILYRTNFQSRPFETALRERDIPYRLIGGTSFYDRKEIKDLVAYLKLINNPDDDVSLLRIVNYPRRGIGESTVEAIRGHAATQKLSLYQAMEDVSHIPGLDPKAQMRIIEFTDLISQFRDEFLTLSLPKTLGRLVDFLDYESAIFKLCKDEKEWQRKLANIRDLVIMMDSYEKKPDVDRDDDFGPSLSGFLNSVSLLYDFPSGDDKDIRDNQVTLLTLHSAKGLEFPHVFLVGLEEGIIPHEHNENIDEERRLCYVGFTRAMETLTLSSCATRKRYGSTELRTPSRFLDEIPAHLIKSASAVPAEDLSHDEAVDYFSRMKDILTES
ncbi:MAG: UvrD-helicase domain-containing protein, partial [Spirochaetota bacterium]|nr:UvrD-helicase domain-containing protein [Spirochaetota bacterium]